MAKTTRSVVRLGVEERFKVKVSIDPSGCHLWTGSIFTKGYGRFGAQRAHRVSWELANGVGLRKL